MLKLHLQYFRDGFVAKDCGVVRIWGASPPELQLSGGETRQLEKSDKEWFLVHEALTKLYGCNEERHEELVVCPHYPEGRSKNSCQACLAGPSDTIVKIHCHGCSEIHEFDGASLMWKREINSPLHHVPTIISLLLEKSDKEWFLVKGAYLCSIATWYVHPPLDKLHRLTDGTYADPEQWYKFTPELWGSYEINTEGYEGKDA